MSDVTPTVGIVILDGNKVCLVKHGEAAQHLTGVHGIPGGRLNGDEELIDAAVREAFEETGLQINKNDYTVSSPTQRSSIETVSLNPIFWTYFKSKIIRLDIFLSERF